MKTREAKRSTAITGGHRSYGDLITSSIEVTNAVRIKRKDDKNSVSDKIVDFTGETIEELIKQGEADALLAIDRAMR